MTTDDKVRAEKLGYDINGEAAKYQYYHQVKLIIVNIFQEKNHCLLMKTELKNKLNLLILLQKKLIKADKNN